MDEKMDKEVYLYVCAGMADWEPALAIAMISTTNADYPKKKTYKVTTFGLNTQPVRTIGGVNILPDTDLHNVDVSNAAMLIIPGANVFIKSDVPELVPLIKACAQNKIPVAAICGGTLFLARNGFLDTVKHTSLGPKWLKKMAPSYRGEKNYVHKPSVSDGGFITASIFGNVEFAYDILKSLEVFPPEYLEVWLSAYKNGYANLDPFLRIDSE